MPLPAPTFLAPTFPSPDTDTARPGLIIRISRGVGVGPTRLSAFDAALLTAGVADYNLIRLSSVIPPGAVVCEVPGDQQIKGEHGDALYCVYAAAWASTPGEQAWAGVAWATRPDGSGSGLFVEHEGSSEATVAGDLYATLESMIASRREHYEIAGMVMSSAECVDHPVCAMTMATYRAQGWDVDGSWAARPR